LCSLSCTIIFHDSAKTSSLRVSEKVDVFATRHSSGTCKILLGITGFGIMVAVIWYWLPSSAGSSRPPCPFECRGRRSSAEGEEIRSAASAMACRFPTWFRARSTMTQPAAWKYKPSCVATGSLFNVQAILVEIHNGMVLVNHHSVRFRIAFCTL
jgi:hypothetical protein